MREGAFGVTNMKAVRKLLKERNKIQEMGDQELLEAVEFVISTLTGEELIPRQASLDTLTGMFPEGIDYATYSDIVFRRLQKIPAVNRR